VENGCISNISVLSFSVIFHFYDYGREVEKNCCPNVAVKSLYDPACLMALLAFMFFFPGDAFFMYLRGVFQNLPSETKKARHGVYFASRRPFDEANH